MENKTQCELSQELIGRLSLVWLHIWQAPYDERRMHSKQNRKWLSKRLKQLKENEQEQKKIYATEKKLEKSSWITV